MSYVAARFLRAPVVSYSRHNDANPLKRFAPRSIQSWHFFQVKRINTYTTKKLLIIYRHNRSRQLFLPLYYSSWFSETFKPLSLKTIEKEVVKWLLFLLPKSFFLLLQIVSARKYFSLPTASIIIKVFRVF